MALWGDGQMGSVVGEAVGSRQAGWRLSKWLPTVGRARLAPWAPLKATPTKTHGCSVSRSNATPLPPRCPCGAADRRTLASRLRRIVMSAKPLLPPCMIALGRNAPGCAVECFRFWGTARSTFGTIFVAALLAALGLCGDNVTDLTCRRARLLQGTAGVHPGDRSHGRGASASTE